MTRIQWFKPQGYKTISNSYGMEIMIDDTYEEVNYRYSGEEEIHSASITCDQEGDAYFTELFENGKAKVHYLNEFMKY